MGDSNTYAVAIIGVLIVIIVYLTFIVELLRLCLEALQKIPPISNQGAMIVIVTTFGLILYVMLMLIFIECILMIAKVAETCSSSRSIALYRLQSFDQ